MKHFLTVLLSTIALNAFSQGEFLKIVQSKPVYSGYQFEYIGAMLNPAVDTLSHNPQATAYWTPQEWMINEAEQKAFKFFSKKAGNINYEQICPCSADKSRNLIRQYLGYINRHSDYMIEIHYLPKNSKSEEWKRHKVLYLPHCHYTYNLTKRRSLTR